MNAENFYEQIAVALIRLSDRSKKTRAVTECEKRNLGIQFPNLTEVVLVTGARQVGKTTMLSERLGGSFNYVTMEEPAAYAQAKADAVLFFQSHELPIIIDEIQRVPELFSPIKWIVDQSAQRGRIVLTGSQTFHLMKGVSESLSGHIRILEMPSLSA